MDNELKALNAEISLLKTQFTERITALEKRLVTFSQKDIDNNAADDSLLLQEKNSFTENTKQHDSTSASPTLTPDASTINDSTISNNQYQAEPVSPREKKPAKPSFIALFLQSILSSFFDWFAPVVNIYNAYKAKGMLGIFVLTVVGIALTLAGFGYLMQLLIDQLGNN